MKINLKVDPDRITLDDLIALETGSTSAVFMRDFLSRFLTDEQGEYMPPEQACIILGKLTLAELRQVTTQFSQSVQELQAAAVPPVSSGG